MPQYTKPNFTSVWAETGSKTEPTTAKINQGWIVEIPPHEMMNWLQNRQDQFLAHVNQMGIPQWDSNTEYQSRKSYVQGTSGIIYRALQTHTNRNPDTDVNGFWTVAFESAGNSLLKNQNLADVPDKPLARQNLGIASTSDYDSRYLLKGANLTDVPNKASARNVLGLGDSAVLNVDQLINIKKTSPFEVITANGLVIKIGTVTTSTGANGGRIITFPERFPTTCIFCSIGSSDSRTSGVEYVQILSHSAVGVDGIVYSDSSTRQTGGAVTFTYMAWGW